MSPTDHESERADAQSVRKTIAAAREGSLDAEGELLGMHYEFLENVAKKEIGKKQPQKIAALDLVQDTMIRAHVHFSEFRGTTQSELTAWLHRILVNQLANARRDLWREKRNIGREQPIDGDERRGKAPIDPSGDDETPSKRAATKEESDQVRLALASLKDDYREAVKLRCWERLTFAQIGYRLGRSEEAARKIWSRAIQKLQHVLKSSSRSNA